MPRTVKVSQDIIESARITAQAWDSPGLVLVTVTTVHGVGGQVWVARQRDARHWSGQPSRLIAEVSPAGNVHVTAPLVTIEADPRRMHELSDETSGWPSVE